MPLQLELRACFRGKKRGSNFFGAFPACLSSQVLARVGGDPCPSSAMLHVFIYWVAIASIDATTVLEFAAGGAWEPFHTCTGVDSRPIAWHKRATNTSYFMSALHERMVAGTAPSLDHAPTACSGPILTSHDAHGYDSGPQSYANFQWLQSVRVFADGTAAGLVHNEFKGEFAPWDDHRYCKKHCADRSPVNASGCRDLVCEIWSTGLAISADGGATFELAASPPQHLVAALPHKYNFNEPISGYGAVSTMLRGADGAFYGLINVKNDCPNNGSAPSPCGNISAGNCIWRAANLKDPASFRARDPTGNFTVQWGSAYVPGGEDKGACATLPAAVEGPFGEHVTFRKIVPPTAADTTRSEKQQQQQQPTFIALGDVPPYSGRVKYSLSYAEDFGAAMRDINNSWTQPQFLELEGLGGGGYFYPTLLDVRSPQLGEASGGVEAQEDGDSFALASYPFSAPPRPGRVESVRVAGAGSSACDGVYTRAETPPGFGSVSNFFRMDATHSVYQNDNVWHLAQIGVKVWYTSVDPSPAGSEGGPPSTGWTVADGNAGMKPAPTSVEVVSRGPSVTTDSSLYLYLRSSGGIMRRKVQLRNSAE